MGELCIGGAILAVVGLLFVFWCCCAVSSQCSRREEEREANGRGGAKIMFGNVNRSNRLSERETTRVLMLIQDNDRLKAELKELRKQVGACIWWEHDQGTSYQTACKHDAHFVDENAREQSYRYCPWCGRRLEYRMADGD